MPNDQKFITDATLAKLAKWLRLLGYDTTVFMKEAGREMLSLAAAENRIVLTKKRDLLARQCSGCLHFVVATDIGSQLREIIEQFSLVTDRQKMFTLCLKCNKRLFPIAKEKVSSFVPPYVFANCHEYHQCPQCQNIYWAGTHPNNAVQFLVKIGCNLG